MNLVFLSFSRKGYELALKLMEGCQEKDYEVKGCVKCRYMLKSEGKIEVLSGSASAYVKKWWKWADGFVFISSCGIAVRMIAPFLEHKAKDPAVVVMDEAGKFSISLLSGHIGGANELCGQLGQMIGAHPVITTATDGRGLFAVDVFAKKNHLFIRSFALAKDISAELLNGTQIGFVCDFPVTGQIPSGLACAYEEQHKPEKGILVSVYEKKPFIHTLQLVPKVLTVGIGCKKGTTCSQIEQAVFPFLKQNGIFMEAIAQAASIDLKKEEPGLLAFCKKHSIPFVTYSAGELLKVSGTFTESDFVKKVTGVGNVCERCAALAGKGTLLAKKQAENGVTFSIGFKEWRADFEK